jgi:MoaA/NifB/PqqE/SkfB family radical SAM enzyme
MIFHKEGSAYDLGVKLADKVNRWLSEQETEVMVHIGSDGDPFASHVYRHLMADSPRGDNIKYSLLTNGLMYSEAVDRVPHIVNNLSRLGVSIDGASASTYEKLRLGGRWDKILSSLKYITKDKSRYGFRLEWHMVVQNDNWREMSDMAKMASDHNVDRLFLNKIEDWNTHLDHEKQDFKSQPGYRDELAKALEYPIVRSWNLS